MRVLHAHKTGGAGYEKVTLRGSPLFSSLREAVAAGDNLKFLLCLEDPCKTLAKAHPEEIPSLLPPILSCIRMVWNISRFYYTPVRVTVLLRKLSNEIISRCCAVIDLPAVFTGDVDGVMASLRQSIEAGGSGRGASAAAWRQLL